jgi:leishmanolysin-like peptidase
MVLGEFIDRAFLGLDVYFFSFCPTNPLTHSCTHPSPAIRKFDRPTAGAINFCLDQIDLDESGSVSESITQDNVDVAVHEAAHVLGMSSNSYRFFWDPETGTERTARPFTSQSVVCVDGVERTLVLPDENTMKFFIATSGQRYASIVTAKVATVARNQFDCQELEGAQLENQPTGENSCTGDHWDERMFYPEALSGVISPTTNVLSPLTLALLEDSGWYRGNYTKANVSPWGECGVSGVSGDAGLR